MTEDRSPEESEKLNELNSSEESVNFNELKEKLKRRCKAAGFKIKERPNERQGYLSITIPNGPNERSVSFPESKIAGILSSNFENCVFLGDYMAVCSYSEGTIEALFRSENPVVSVLLEKDLFRYLSRTTEENEKKTIELLSSNKGSSIKISISPVSSNSILLFFSRISLRSSALSLKISGLQVTQHDDALDILQKIANSLFFQIDLLLGIPLNLTRDNRITSFNKSRRARQKESLEFPSREYNQVPISLYWYARSASRMPLLQFLAYYQVIEYHFPIYSQEALIIKIRSILKDPTFRLDKDTDIKRILSAFNGSGKGYANERSQFKATLNACLQPEEIFRFLTETPDSKKFFSSKQTGLTERSIFPKSLQNSSEDFRDTVAEVLYEIRCKIVHTKGETYEGEVEILLPFSKGTELLSGYIELIKYISQRVLIVSSSALDL